MAPRERVVATSASPSSILARRFRVGSSELLAGPCFNNPPVASEGPLPVYVRSPRKARRRRAAERGGRAWLGDGFSRRKGSPRDVSLCRRKPPPVTVRTLKCRRRSSGAGRFSQEGRHRRRAQANGLELSRPDALGSPSPTLQRIQRQL